MRGYLFFIANVGLLGVYRFASFARESRYVNIHRIYGREKERKKKGTIERQWILTVFFGFDLTGGEEFRVPFVRSRKMAALVDGVDVG